MTDPTLDAINAVRKDLGDLRSDLNGRMDNVITRREHDAEVRRIDAETESVRSSLAQHERDASRRLEEIESDVAAGDAKILAELQAERAQRSAEAKEADAQRTADRAQRAADAKAAAEQRKTDRRWVVGAVIAAAGVAVALAQLLRAFLA